MKFKHYKGGEYELVTLAMDEATNEPLVVYKALSDGTVWSRPAKVFFERRKEGGQRFEIQLAPGQELSCSEGCDSPKLAVEAFEFSREETTDGTLISSRCKPDWKCRCGGMMGIYHEIDGDVTDLDEPQQPYAAAPTQVDLPPRVIDKLFQAAGVSTYHPDGDQLEKLHAFAHGVAAEVLARRRA
jgi:hypothetical protein